MCSSANIFLLGKQVFFVTCHKYIIHWIFDDSTMFQNFHNLCWIDMSTCMIKLCTKRLLEIQVMVKFGPNTGIVILPQFINCFLFNTFSQCDLIGCIWKCHKTKLMDQNTFICDFHFMERLYQKNIYVKERAQQKIRPTTVTV